MKTFNQFITEAKTTRSGDHQQLDDYRMSKRTDTPLEVGRIGAKRKKRELDKTRTKAVGGGKTVPAKSYKPRKDIGTNKPRSEVQQQPQKERGSAALSAREAQKKAYRERKAREAAGQKKSTSLAKDRNKLLTKKTTPTDPSYKPRKASGKTEKERKALYKKGERTLRDIRLKNLGKTSEKELKHRVTSK